MKSIIVAAMALLVCGEQLRAQLGVFDPTNYAENVLHYSKAVAQLKAAEAQISNQVQALKKLGHPSWRSVAGTVSAVDGAMADANGIGYAVAHPGQSLLATFTGRATRTYPADRQQQSARTLSTLSAGLDGAHAEAATVGPGAHQVDQFQRQTASVEGHEQALELGSSVAVFNAQELLLLRQAVAAQSAMEAVYFADRVNEQAQADANVESVVAGMTRPIVRRVPFSLRPAP